MRIRNGILILLGILVACFVFYLFLPQETITITNLEPIKLPPIVIP